MVMAGMAVMLTAKTAMAQGPGPAGAAAAPLRAKLLEVRPSALARTVHAVGTLRANEAVELVPELSRRVTGIHFTEGAAVAAGDLLFQLDDADLRAEIEETKAKISLAEANDERARVLFPQKAISRQELDAARAEVEVLRAQLKAQEVELLKTRITAPFTGKIGTRRVSEGAFVVPGTVLATLQDLSRIKVEFSLPERYAAEVRSGLAFVFRVAGSGKDHEGVVDVVEPEFDAATRSVRLRGICARTEGLFPGGFAEVRLTLEGDSHGFQVPSQAIVPTPRGQAVYVIEDGKAVLRPVETGIRSDSDVQILRGLEEGEKVALTNLLRMRPGVAVVAEEELARP
jgi:membrane fusion protein, multidrug efflux system